MFLFWFNTYFVEDDYLCLSKPELDKACKDKSHKLYDEDFRVELYFNGKKPASSAAAPGSSLSPLAISKPAGVLVLDEDKSSASGKPKNLESIFSQQTLDENTSNDIQVLRSIIE